MKPTTLLILGGIAFLAYKAYQNGGLPFLGICPPGQVAQSSGEMGGSTCQLPYDPAHPMSYLLNGQQVGHPDWSYVSLSICPTGIRKGDGSCAQIVGGMLQGLGGWAV
jgi:hypothetical protein